MSMLMLLLGIHGRNARVLRWLLDGDARVLRWLLDRDAKVADRRLDRARKIHHRTDRGLDDRRIMLVERFRRNLGHIGLGKVRHGAGRVKGLLGRDGLLLDMLRGCHLRMAGHMRLRISWLARRRLLGMGIPTGRSLRLGSRWAVKVQRRLDHWRLAAYWVSSSSTKLWL